MLHPVDLGKYAVITHDNLFYDFTKKVMVLLLFIRRLL